MAFANIQGSNIGDGLRGIMLANDIFLQGGPDYQLCKDIYLFHPLGAKIAEKPIEIAQSQKRDISVTGAGTCEAECKQEFEATWRKIEADTHIFNVMSLSRVYGAAVIAVLEDGVENRKAVDYWNLHKKNPSFNVYDPLNVAGSLVLSQDTLMKSFLKVQNIAVGSEQFHRSRARAIFNENPMYISWTSSAYGYTGRSVYQRALLPMKSFVQTMVTDDMVARKAGVIVAKIKQAGSVVNQKMRNALGFKRNVVQEAETGNVISIGTEGEEIQSLDLKNLSEPFQGSRKNILENIASAVPMPAKMLTEESFSTGLAEGSEDAKAQARYVDRIREKMDSLYVWFDKITMHLAWTPEFFARMQETYEDEYGKMSYEEFFWNCSNSFKAQWPSLLKEPESDLVKVEETKLKAVIEWTQVLLPNIPPEERAEVIKWANDQFNNMPMLFGAQLNLNYDIIADYDKTPEGEDTKDFGEPNLTHAHDSMDKFGQKLIEYLEKRENERKRLTLVK